MSADKHWAVRSEPAQSSSACSSSSVDGDDWQQHGDPASLFYRSDRVWQQRTRWGRRLSTHETHRRLGGSTRTQACHCDVLDQQQTRKVYFCDSLRLLLSSWNPWWLQGFCTDSALKTFLLFQTFPLRQNEIKSNKIYTVWWILTKNKHIKHKDHVYKLVEHTTVRLYTLQNFLSNLYGHFNDNFKKKKKPPPCLHHHQPTYQPIKLPSFNLLKHCYA